MQINEVINPVHKIFIITISRNSEFDNLRKGQEHKITTLDKQEFSAVITDIEILKKCDSALVTFSRM